MFNSGSVDWPTCSCFGGAQRKHSNGYNLGQCKLGLAILASLCLLHGNSLVRRLRHVSLQRFLEASFIFSMPLGWFCVLENHSIVHFWFVSASLFPSFAIAAAPLLTRPGSKSLGFADANSAVWFEPLCRRWHKWVAVGQKNESTATAESNRRVLPRT